MSSSTEARDEEYNGYKYKTKEEARRARKKQVNEAAKKHYWKMKAKKLEEKKEDNKTVTGEQTIENKEGSIKDNPLAEILKDLNIKGADKVMKYIPLAQSIVQGLMNKQQATNKVPTPPPGYGTMAALQYKNDPVWQAQANAYKEWKIKQGLSNLDLKGSHDPTLKAEQFEPELKKPNWNDNPKEEKKEEEKEEVKQEAAVNEEAKIQEAYMKEITTQLTFITNYLNNMKEEEFKEWMTQEEKLLGMLEKAPLQLFPGLVNSINNSNGKELLSLIEKECPQKYAILKKERKIKKAEELLNKVIEAL